MAKIEVHLRHYKNKLKERFPKVLGDAFLADSTNRTMFVGTGILYISAWIIAIVRFQPSDYLVPIRFSSFLGVTQLGNWYELYSVPLILTFCILINLVLADLTYKKDRMVSYIFTGANIFLAVVSLSVIISFSFIIGN